MSIFILNNLLFSSFSSWIDFSFISLLYPILTILVILSFTKDDKLLKSKVLICFKNRLYK